MSDMTPQAAALLQRARDLLEPEPEQIAAVRGALARKLEAGAAPSCGELAALGRSGLAARGLLGLGGKLGLAAGLTLFAGAGVLVLRGDPDGAAVPSARVGTVVDATAGSMVERAEPSMGQPEAAVPEPPGAIAERPTRGSGRPAEIPAPALPRSAVQTGDPLARGASVRVARRAATTQLTRGAEPAQAGGEPSAASRAVASRIAANSGMEQNAATSARPAAIPPARQPAEEGARAAPEQPQQRPTSAPIPERDLLVREVAMLEGARTALERGDDARALQILDAHAREFPAGALSEEQLALRARALCALGRIDEGRRAVQRLAARAPKSPHLKRSQAVCALGG